ncbi:MAG: DUF402 domain-containing protein [Erysipelotrichaceae bacterium]|nr:DUF402 domain-containing protein [Erysipelotrichaceae bacterium]
MQSLVGEDVLIHCYKHDGSIHRCWNKGHVLEETNQHFIVINNRTLVSESDGRKWYTREPAIWYFPKNQWYNVICMIRKNGVHFYCNLASPTLYDGQAIKYIDYDLDLKVFPDYKYRILDEEEYLQNSQKMQYGKDIDAILHEQLDLLINQAMDMAGPFRPGFAQYWYQQYQQSSRRHS